MADEGTWECSECGRRLDDADPVVSMALAGGERRAYECACGAVTVTVAAGED